ncbi:MAG: hypothetical protein HYZ27_11585, partial [Deltaproteobacteria bacterium]|nr:hypothetical protein [Deltaproteobacteria bacterium]
VRDRWRASFEGKAGTHTLRCNEATESYKRLSPKEVKAWAKKARLHDVRWQRQAVFIARDDNATYYLVDQAREPEGNRDYRLFIGTKGKLAHVSLNDAIVDAESTLYVSAAGKLAVTERYDGATAVWKSGNGDTSLTVLDLFTQAPFVYTELGVYSGQALGSACDHVLGK